MGLEWTELTAEEKDRFKAKYDDKNPNMTDFIRFPKQRLLFPRSCLKINDSIKNLALKEDDIWIVTYPKCGTTWMQEITTMLIRDVDENYAKLPLLLRSPFLEIDALMAGPDGGSLMGKVMKGKSQSEMPESVKAQFGELLKGNVNLANKMTGRRVLKSHYSFDFLPDNLQEKCKVIYVARNPKDCAVSFFHHLVNMPLHGFTESFQSFVADFMKGLLMYGDYWAHLESGWKLKDHPNVKFIWFEEIKKDSKKVIQELTEFLGHPLSEEKMDALVKHVSFDMMKKNPAANPTVHLQGMGEDKNFMRKGKVGDWKNHFSGDEIAAFDAWIKKNVDDTGIILPV